MYANIIVTAHFTPVEVWKFLAISSGEKVTEEKINDCRSIIAFV